jgi:hypothetical protein
VKKPEAGVHREKSGDVNGEIHAIIETAIRGVVLAIGLTGPARGHRTTK